MSSLSLLRPEAISNAPVLAVDLGGTRVRVALVGPDGRLATRDEDETRSELGPDRVIGDIVAMLQGVRARAPSDLQAALAGIGIAAPGPLDPATGRMIEPPNLGTAFRGADVAGPIGRALGLPAALERDTNVALLAECMFGAARGAREAIYLTISTGVGGAILTDGRVIAGADNLAGELGHIVLELDGPPCGCGGRGHFEALTSGTGIARAAEELIAAGRAPGLARLASRATDGSLSAKDVAEAEDAGDPDAAWIMGRARDGLAAAMVGIVNVFNPEVVVIGGAVAQGQGERLLAPARKRVADEAFERQAARVRILAAELGDDVGLVGALGLAGSRLGDAGLGGGIGSGQA